MVAKPTKPRRKRKAPLVSRQERSSLKTIHVEYIYNEMSAKRWVRGESAIGLGEEWGLNTKTVEGYAAEAWRRVCREANDADAMRPEIAGILRTNLEAASDRNKFDNVAKIADVYSKIIGARAPDRHEHAVIIAQFDTLNRKGKIAWIDQHLAKLKEAREVLEASED